MGKRKPRNKTLATTLTKIDPEILKPKPPAVSQHAASNGARVTATINPVVQLPPPVDSIIFDFDLESIDENPVAYCGEEDHTGAYYVSRVRDITRRCVPGLTLTRTTRSYCGGMSAIYFSKNLSDSKAEECLQTAIVNSAPTKARSAVLIVSRFSSFVGNAFLVSTRSIHFTS